MRLIWVGIIFFMMSFSVSGQIVTCGVDYLENNFTSPTDYDFPDNAPTQFTLPVVVHIIHLGEAVGVGTNISDAQIQSAIVGSNNDFMNQSAQGQSIWGVDTEIQWCLARRDPNGLSTSGIMRYDGNLIPNYSIGGIGAPGATEFDVKAPIVWDITKYYNIYVVAMINGNSGGGVQGYAYYPPASPVGNWWDGTVVLFNAFGTVGNLKSYTNKNTVLTHELGHALNLVHTFQGNTCTETSCTTQGDFVCDTPPTTQNAVCSPRACGWQQVENYLDYTPETCKNTFTNGQKIRMLASINGNATRYLTATSGKCIPLSNTLTASFTASDTLACPNQPIEFLSTSTNAMTYEWTFPSGSPATSTSQVVNVIWNTPGTYLVKLKVTSGFAWDSASVTKTIIVQACTVRPHIYAHATFGTGAGLKFWQQGTKQFEPCYTTGQESSATISDSNGNLLFYTNGRTVWRANATQMTTLLNGSPNSPTILSATDGVMILPSKVQSNIYWIITVSDAGQIGYGLTAYTVDMNLNGGTGDVISTTPYNPTPNYRTTEGLTAVPACDGTGYFIITHGAPNINPSNPILNLGVGDMSDKMLVYYFNGSWGSLTVNDSYQTSATDVNSWLGQYTARQDGKFVALSNYGGRTYLYNFDRSTGSATYRMSFGGGMFPGTGYGCAFSPNGNVLYTTDLTWMYGRDISTIDTDTASLSYYIHSSSYDLHGIMEGIDGNMYVARFNKKYVSSITNPNTPAPANFVAQAINLANSRLTKFGMTNHVQAMFAPTIPCIGPLPVTFLYARGKKQNDNILIEWATGTEINNSHFIVERLTEKKWIEIASVTGAGNSITTNYYEWRDFNYVDGSNYYRIAQIDYDGISSHSNIIHIKSIGSTEINGKVYNVMGQEVSGELKQGIYYIKVGDKLYKYVKL